MTDLTPGPDNVLKEPQKTFSKGFWRNEYAEAVNNNPIQQRLKTLPETELQSSALVPNRQHTKDSQTITPAKQRS